MLPGVKTINVGNEAVQLNFMEAHHNHKPTPPMENIECFCRYALDLYNLSGVDAVMISCSTMNRAYTRVEATMKPFGVPVFTIDRAMMEEAVSLGNVHADNPSNVYWDKHSGWTWTMLKDKFEKEGLTFIMPADQNGGRDYDGLQSDKKNFDWIITSPARKNPLYKPDSWNWLYSRLVVCIRPDGRCFDVSDAGMIIYMLTGIEKTSPDMAREIMENPEPRK